MDDVEHVDVAQVVEELARTTNELQRVVDQLADRDLQLSDVRRERNHEHRRADEAEKQVEADTELLESANELTAELEQQVAKLQTGMANSTTIGQADGIIAEKTGLSVEHAHQWLSGFSRKNSRRLLDVCSDIVAEQDNRPPVVMDTIAAVLAGPGVPIEFWNELTLNGAIFE